MTPTEEQTLALLLKKRDEENAKPQGAPVLRLIKGGGDPNAMSDKLEEFAAMARRGELFDYAITVVNSDGVTVSSAWGSPVPTLQIVAAAGSLWFHLNANLRRI